MGSGSPRSAGPRGKGAGAVPAARTVPAVGTQAFEAVRSKGLLAQSTQSPEHPPSQGHFPSPSLPLTSPSLGGQRSDSRWGK